MQSQHYNGRHRTAREIFEITLRRRAARVRLMDDTSFRNYRAGRHHLFHVDHTTQSPVRIRIPRRARRPAL